MAPVPRNHMLGSLSPSDLALIEPHLKTIALPQGDVLLQQDVHMAHFYFPTDGMVSLVAVLEDGGSIEVAAIGREGVVGAALANGTGNAPMTAIVQVAGNASRIEAGKFHDAARESATFRKIVAHHNEALIAQIIRTVACNGKHVLEARLCRWLLMVHDRVNGETLNLTQEFLGQMLGAQRTSVNLAARKLQDARLVTYNRGRITIVDRAGLEEAACECYAIGRKHFDRLMSLRNTE